MEDAISKVLTSHEMRPYLEQQLLPDVRQSIKELLKQIVDNKELDRHWASKERENQKLIRQTRRAELDRKRLEMGSAYESDEEEKQLDEEDFESSTDSYYDEEEEGEDESEEHLASLSDASRSQNKNSAMGDIIQSPTPLDMQSRSALGKQNALFGDCSNALGATGKDSNNNLKNTAKTTRSIRSLRSRHSIMGSQIHFNPLRFLAMSLIEKNQERKEFERRKKQADLEQFLAGQRAEAEKVRQAAEREVKKDLAEIASETEDEDGTGKGKPINVDVQVPLRGRQDTFRKKNASPKQPRFEKSPTRRKPSQLEIRPRQ